MHLPRDITDNGKEARWPFTAKEQSSRVTELKPISTMAMLYLVSLCPDQSVHAQLFLGQGLPPPRWGGGGGGGGGGGREQDRPFLQRWPCCLAGAVPQTHLTQIPFQVQGTWQGLVPEPCCSAPSPNLVDLQHTSK